MKIIQLLKLMVQNLVLILHIIHIMINQYNHIAILMKRPSQEQFKINHNLIN